MYGEDPNTDVVLTIAGLTPEGLPCGRIKIGEGPPIPPVTDADASYPPTWGAGGGMFASRGAVFTTPWQGYEYELLHVQSTPIRLAFGISLNEVLRPWCQLQVAYADSYSCLPAYQSAIGDPPCKISGPKLPSTPVPCFKLQFCSPRTCFCYDGRCDASAAARIAFELHWDGDALEGTVNDQLIFLDPVAP